MMTGPSTPAVWCLTTQERAGQSSSTGYTWGRRSDGTGLFGAGLLRSVLSFTTILGSDWVREAFAGLAIVKNQPQF